MSTLLDKFEEHEKEFISVHETLDLIMQATKGTLEQAKDYLLVIKLHEHVPVLYRDEKRLEFKGKPNDGNENGFDSTYSVLKSELKGNEYFSIKALNDFEPLDEYDVFAYRRGYHYVAQHSVGRFKTGAYVIGLDDGRAGHLLSTGAVEKLTIKEVEERESKQVKFLTKQLADARAQLIAEQASTAIKSEEIESPVYRMMEENRRKYIAVNDFVNNLSKSGSLGAGNPLKITVKYILENIPLNEINLYGLKGTEYLLASQTDEFKYKGAAEILQSVYDILDNDQTGTVSSDRKLFKDFYFAYSEVGCLIGSDSKMAEKESSIHIDKQSSVNNPKPSDDSSVITNLGKNQRLLITYALFTADDMVCLIIDENPACISHNDNYLAHHRMVSNAIDAGFLIPNDTDRIPAEQVKIWLANYNFIYKGFNDGTLTYADQLAEMTEEAVEANVKILNLTAKLEDTKLDSIIHSRPAHKFLINEAQATIEQLSKENAELRANKKMESSQPKQDGEVSNETVEKLKKMVVDYEELSLKYEELESQNKGLLDKVEQYKQYNNEELTQHWEAESKKYKSKIEELEGRLKKAEDDLKEVPHQAHRTVIRVMYAMAKMTRIDNSNPYSQNLHTLNGEITTLLQNDGLKLEHQSVGKWLSKINNIQSMQKK